MGNNHNYSYTERNGSNEKDICIDEQRRTACFEG